MFKSIMKNSSPPSRPTTQNSPPSLGERLAAFADTFQKHQEYPPALVNVSTQKLKSRKHRIMPTKPIEMMPPNTKGQTRFHTAALFHDRKWMRLICQGAQDEDLLKADIYGNTPLHYAAKRELLNELVLHRSSINCLLEARDEEGNTPLHIMALAKKFDRSMLLKIEPSILKKLLNMQNEESHTVLQIIKDNGDHRLLNALSLLCQETSAKK